jgi:outer membrane receptor protein involved in Fe transport
MNFMKRFAVVLALLMLVSVVASAQTTSSLTGTVTLGGNPLPGATITISSPGLQGVRTTNSDVNGNYNFGALPPGTYTVKFDMESMQSVNKTVQVTLSGTARADAEMKLTAMAEAITVTATAPAVLETTEIQTNIQASTIDRLAIGRTLTATTSLAPGVATASGSGGASAGAIQISGAPAYDSVFMVNGASINENLRGQPHALFIEDAIQETTVLSGGISAEYGRFTGGVVNAITKSGGNEFSGSIRDSLTNDKWTSVNTAYFDQAGLPENPQVDKVNSVYEATLGGRIIRDRLWFFGAGRYAKISASRNLQDVQATPYTFGDKNTRYEGKLTGQITDKHSLVLSYLDIKNPQSNNCFAPCEEFSNLDTSRSLPNHFATVHYNGILTNSLLIEGSYSKKYFAFQGSGGDFSDFAHGSYGNDLENGGYFGAPVFCGFCTPEERNNKLYGAKATYYLASKSFGTHNIATGYEQWAEQRIANNYQSGSNYQVYVNNAPVCSNGVCHPFISEGDQIKYSPIPTLTQGSNFRTDSFYVNDKWDLNTKLNFNLGLRYDKNHGVDSAGQDVSKDSNVSPRLGVIFDVMGNGRLRLNASYSKYVSRIAETLGGAGSGAGNPAYFYYEYRGPDINANHTLTTPEAFQALYNWFQSVGGINNHDLIVSGQTPGLSAHILGSLKSPNVNEWTVGAGTQLTNSAYLRADIIHRDWNDFYARFVNTSTGQAVDPVAGPLDVALFSNSNAYDRKYDALQLQGAYTPWSRVNIGANYTYSKLKGNVQEETSGSGPVPEDAFRYPEYRSFAANNPTGYLPSDQRHKARAWVSFDIPTFVGSFNLSLLQRFDSGTPYSQIAIIDPRRRTTGAASLQCATCPANPGYVTPPASVNYFLNGRGNLRFDDVSNTDLGLNYEIPISRLRLFAQAKLINAFNNQAQINGNTTGILTSKSASCIQNVGPNAGQRCQAFNPFTTTPVEGVNYRYTAAFGAPRTPTTTAGTNLLAPNGDYQLPRTYLFSFGARF